VTPSPDLISQLLMALPLMGLYELSILLSKLIRKKPAQAPSEGDGNKVQSPAST
jgi:sec-independent protein translocase protein TatC